ncbi:MAG TPA: hypothetical protein VNZ54_04735, partial [bacterium]|nr:hypothetical protein [bacterium]
MNVFQDALHAASKILVIGLLAAAFGPGRALACTPDSLGNTGSGSYAIQSSGVLEAVQAQSAYAFTMSAININIYQISGTAQLNVAFYSDAGGVPGTLLAQSTSGIQTAVVGWNTFPMPALTYTAGTYWLAFQASTNGVYFNNDFSVSPTVNTIAVNTFGSFPPVWTNGGGFNDFLWSDYAVICSTIVSPSPTATASPTATISPTPSMTQSWTASPTPSPPPTATPTATLSSTTDPTLTPTLSATASATASWTQSTTASPTATATATGTATPTASPSPTVTPTATPPPTRTSTASPTATASPSFTATATPTPTASLTITASPTVTASPSAS